MSAGERLQAAAIEALRTAPGIVAIYDGPPLQAAFPHAVVECGPEIDWGHKSGGGREVRLAVTIMDGGERPGRLQRLMGEAEAALGGFAAPLEGWELVTFVFTRRRAVREA